MDYHERASFEGGNQEQLRSLNTLAEVIDDCVYLVNSQRSFKEVAKDFNQNNTSSAFIIKIASQYWHVSRKFSSFNSSRDVRPRYHLNLLAPNAPNSHPAFNNYLQSIFMMPMQGCASSIITPRPDDQGTKVTLDLSDTVNFTRSLYSTIEQSGFNYSSLLVPAIEANKLLKQHQQYVDFIGYDGQDMNLQKPTGYRPFNNLLALFGF